MRRCSSSRGLTWPSADLLRCGFHARQNTRTAPHEGVHYFPTLPMNLLQTGSAFGTQAASFVQGDSDEGLRELHTLPQSGEASGHTASATSANRLSSSKTPEPVLLFPEQWQALADAEVHSVLGHIAFIERRWDAAEADSSAAIDRIAGARAFPIHARSSLHWHCGWLLFVIHVSVHRDPCRGASKVSPHSGVSSATPCRPYTRIPSCELALAIPVFQLLNAAQAGTSCTQQRSPRR